VAGPALLAILIWFAPSESEARAACSSKPAVCARLKAQQAQRATTPALSPAPARLATSQTARCTTKPIVCARIEAIGARPAAPPVTMAAMPIERCTTKPAVCARLKMQPSSTPVTLANAETAPRAVR
jgi:hypothetical protein